MVLPDCNRPRPQSHCMGKFPRAENAFKTAERPGEMARGEVNPSSNPQSPCEDGVTVNICNPGLLWGGGGRDRRVPRSSWTVSMGCPPTDLYMHTQAHTHIHRHTHTHRHTYSHTHTDKHTQTQIQTLTHTQTYTHTETHTQKHRSPPPSNLLNITAWPCLKV